MLITHEESLCATEFIDLLKRSSLAERRPVHDVARIEKMLSNASIIACARDAEGVLVGVARAISDFAYCTYLSDLAVDVKYQRRGIGKQLIESVRLASGSSTTLILLAAPAAESYYPHIGMKKHESCWISID